MGSLLEKVGRLTTTNSEAYSKKLQDGSSALEWSGSGDYLFNPQGLRDKLLSPDLCGMSTEARNSGFKAKLAFQTARHDVT